MKWGLTMIAFDLYPHRCKTCGKKFEAGGEYAYKTEQKKGRYIWFCSWHCLQKYRAEGERKKVTFCAERQFEWND